MANKKSRKTKHETIKKESKESSFVKSNIMIIVGVSLLVIALITGILIMKNKTQPSNYTGKTVTIVEYSDFQCPFCKRAEDDAVAKLKKNFGNAIVWEYKHFPLSFHPLAQKAAEATECARDQGKFWEMHAKLFEVSPALEVDKLKGYAKDLGLDTSKFNTCLDTGAKTAKVAADFAEGQSKGVTGTPAFFINGQSLVGAQPYESFLPIICKSIPDHTACVNAPKPVSFKMYVIEDKRCVDCDSSRIIQVINQFFPGVEVVQLDYTSSKGKELYDKAGVVYMPTYVMESQVKDDPSFSKIEKAMVNKNGYYVIQPQAVGASFDPNAEICTNKIDDNADGIIDCADSKCSQSLECREELKKNIQVFIMSDCPYGKKAVEALYEAKKNFGSEMSFDIHYIASDNSDGTFNSLHGAYEAEEDIRQVCVRNISPDKFLDYTNCRSLEGIRGTDYKKCAVQFGIDLKTLDTCTTGDQGKQLFRDDIKIAEGLGIGASPTWLANNRYEFSGIDAETVKQNFCKLCF